MRYGGKIPGSSTSTTYKSQHLWACLLGCLLHSPARMGTGSKGDNICESTRKPLTCSTEEGQCRHVSAVHRELSVPFCLWGPQTMEIRPTCEPTPQKTNPGRKGMSQLQRWGWEIRQTIQLQLSNQMETKSKLVG